MLNRFRIGMKLGIGFLIVLTLLVAVAAVAYIGLEVSSRNMNKALKTEDLRTNVQSMQREAFMAQIVSCDTELYGDPENVKNRYPHDEEIARISAEIESDLSPENKNFLEKLVEHYESYKKSDDAWDGLEQNCQAARKEMNENADAFKETLKTLQNELMSLGPESEGGEGGGFETMPVSRVIQVVDTETCMSEFEAARRLFYMFLATKAEEEAEGYRNQLLEEQLPLIQERLQRIRDSVNEEQKKRVDAIGDSLEAWKASFDKHDACVEEQAKSDVIFEDAVHHVDSYLEKMDEILNQETETIRDYANATDLRIIRTIIAVAVFAVAFGIIVSFALSRDITKGIGRVVEFMNMIAKDGNLALEISASDLNRGDEVGDLTQALDSILHEFQNVEHLAVNLADGNWTVRKYAVNRMR